MAIRGFVEIGAMASACDLILSSDSAVAQLTGGLGPPTWLLLEKIPGWRCTSRQATSSSRPISPAARGRWCTRQKPARSARAQRPSAVGKRSMLASR